MKAHIQLHNVVDQVSRPNFCGGLIKYHLLENKEKKIDIFTIKNKKDTKYPRLYSVSYRTFYYGGGACPAKIMASEIVL